MAFDFPNSPTEGQVFTPAGGPAYIYHAPVWELQSVAGGSAVCYDIAQTLSGTQQAQARQNIYAAPFDAMAYNGLQVNGAMEICQARAINAQLNNSGFLCDQWILYYNGPGLVAAQCANNSGLPAIPNYLNVYIGTAEPSLAAGTTAEVYTSIEGYRVARLNFGTAQASPVTVGFWTSHHRTGTYSFAWQSNAAARSYCTTYTHNVADVWQYNTVTIPGDVTGTWDKYNLVGALLVWSIAQGANFITTPNVWVSTNTPGATGQVNGIGATTDVFRLTGVTVHPGTEAPNAARSPYIMRSFDQELQLCRRYYQKSYAAGTIPGTVTSDGPLFLADRFSGAGAITIYQTIILGTVMRANPTMTIYSPGTGATGKIKDGAFGVDVNATVYRAEDSYFVWAATGNGTSAVVNFQLHWVADARI